MRIPPVLVSMLLLASVVEVVCAQDLEYRVKMQTSMADMPYEANLPSPETVLFIKGMALRTDMKMAGFSRSSIFDNRARKMYVVNHSDRSYTEQSLPSDLDSIFARGDTAALRAIGLIPVVVPMPEVRAILGYETRRVLTVRKMPNPIEAGSFLVMAAEMWVSQDPRLMKVYDAIVRAAQETSGAGMAIPGMVDKVKGIPLETEMVMLKYKGDGELDPAKLLKGPPTEGFVSRTRMTVTELKFGNLPDSLFIVPADYRKTN